MGLPPIGREHSLPYTGPPEDFRDNTPTVIQMHCDSGSGVGTTNPPKQRPATKRRENGRVKRVWRELD